MRACYPMCLLFLVTACSDEVPESVVDENSAIDTISEQALKDHLAYLADDAR